MHIFLIFNAYKSEVCLLGNPQLRKEFSWTIVHLVVYHTVMKRHTFSVTIVVGKFA